VFRDPRTRDHGPRTFDNVTLVQVDIQSWYEETTPTFNSILLLSSKYTQGQAKRHVFVYLKREGQLSPHKV